MTKRLKAMHAPGVERGETYSANEGVESVAAASAVAVDICLFLSSVFVRASIPAIFDEMGSTSRRLVGVDAEF